MLISDNLRVRKNYFLIKRLLPDSVEGVFAGLKGCGSSAVALEPMFYIINSFFASFHTNVCVKNDFSVAKRE